MDQYLVFKGPHVLFSGKCLLFKFPNGWGASAVRHSASKGGPEGFWEVALVSFPDPENDKKWVIRTDTSFMCDTAGYLFIDEVLDYLDKIKALPAEVSSS